MASGCGARLYFLADRVVEITLDMYKRPRPLGSFLEMLRCHVMNHEPLKKSEVFWSVLCFAMKYACCLRQPGWNDPLSAFGNSGRWCKKSQAWAKPLACSVHTACGLSQAFAPYHYIFVQRYMLHENRWKHRMLWLPFIWGSFCVDKLWCIFVCFQFCIDLRSLALVDCVTQGIPCLEPLNHGG